jgi:hypothetical protein
MYDSAMKNARLSSTEVLMLVDADDPTLQDYLDSNMAVRVLAIRLGYTGSLNAIASEVASEHSIIGAFGDDVIFRTSGWDRKVTQTLANPGIAYGDDRIHGRNHPSAVWMSTVIYQALGWLALPATTHQWADDGWKRLGQKLGILRFIPNVVVEHMHPGVGKAEWDETYDSVFQPERAKADHDGFNAWVENGGLEADAAKVQAMLEAMH